MRRRPKPAKVSVEGKPPLTPKSSNCEGSLDGQLQRRLEEPLKREAEAREQQTATSEILRIIALEQNDLQTVFDTVVRSAARLCHAVLASVLLTDGRNCSGRTR